MSRFSLGLILVVCGRVVGTLDPDVWRDTSKDMIEQNGYPYEQHMVTTRDGYILQIDRLGTSQRSRPPILLLPGLMESSEGYLAKGPPNALPYYLADRGYDVWLGNPRGTRHSLGHTHRNTNDPLYWDFSFDEMGEYDLPAFVDYILAVTGWARLDIIGKSQGATMSLVGLIVNPEYYATRLRSVVMLTPYTTMEHTESAILVAMKFLRGFELVQWLGFHSVMNYNKFVAMGVVYLRQVFPGLFWLLSSLMNDRYPETLDFTKEDVFYAHFPAGSSTKNQLHVMQLMSTPGFYRYRKSPKEPLKPYNFTQIPPVPIFILSGAGDRIAVSEGVIWLSKQLHLVGKSHSLKIYPLMGHKAFAIPHEGYLGFLDDIHRFLLSI